MTERLIRRPEVEATTGLGRSAMYNMIASGNFPKSVKIGVRTVAWSADEIANWIKTRIRARDAGDQPGT